MVQLSPPSPQEAAPPLPKSAPPLPSPAPPLPKRPLFARGYNDLILRTYDELAVWKNYLLDNPRRLLMKHARPDWLYPFFGLKLGPLHLQRHRQPKPAHRPIPGRGQPRCRARLPGHLTR